MYDPQFAIFRAILSLCATLGLIVICGWLWRTYGQNLNQSLKWPAAATPRQRRLQVLETQRLNATTTLYLVKLDATELLLATTAAQTTLISTLSSSPQPRKSAKVKA